jgi:hypothetical protein
LHLEPKVVQIELDEDVLISGAQGDEPADLVNPEVVEAGLGAALDGEDGSAAKTACLALHVYLLCTGGTRPLPCETTCLVSRHGLEHISTKVVPCQVIE